MKNWLTRRFNASKGKPTTSHSSTRFRPTLDTLDGREMPASLIPGGIVSGSIAQTAEVDSWTFTGRPGDRVELISTSTPTQAGFFAYFDVFAPSGTRVAESRHGSNLTLDLKELGVYTLRIRDDYFKETGLYTIGLEGLRPFSPGATPLVKGGIVQGTISSSIEKDQWTFAGMAGDRIELMITGTPTQSGFYAFADVYAPSGTRVESLWSGKNLTLDLRETGTYMVQIRDDYYVETGNYTIGLEGLRPFSPGATSLIKGGIVQGTISSSIEKDQWTFAGKVGDRIELMITGSPTQVGFYAFADVYAPSGTRVESLWSGKNLTLDLRETGTYMVQIRDDYYVETGNYTIGLEGLNPVSPGATSLIKGGIVQGTISSSIEKDQWTFAGKAGDRIELMITGTPTQVGFYAFADVYAPSGTRVESLWSGKNLTLDLRETGTYMVQIRDDYYVETGNYTIGLEGLNPVSPDAKALALNTTITGSIDVSTEKDQYVVNVPIGKKLKLTLSGIATDPGFRVYANLFGPSGVSVGGMGTDTQTFSLSVPGVYLIQVGDADFFKRGTYSLMAQLV